MGIHRRGVKNPFHSAYKNRLVLEKGCDSDVHGPPSPSGFSHNLNKIPHYFGKSYKKMKVLIIMEIRPSLCCWACLGTIFIFKKASVYSMECQVLVSRYWQFVRANVSDRGG